MNFYTFKSVKYCCFSTFLEGYLIRHCSELPPFFPDLSATQHQKQNPTKAQLFFALCYFLQKLYCLCPRGIFWLLHSLTLVILDTEKEFAHSIINIFTWNIHCSWVVNICWIKTPQLRQKTWVSYSEVSANPAALHWADDSSSCRSSILWLVFTSDFTFYWKATHFQLHCVLSSAMLFIFIWGVYLAVIECFNSLPLTLLFFITLHSPLTKRRWGHKLLRAAFWLYFCTSFTTRLVYITKVGHWNRNCCTESVTVCCMLSRLCHTNTVSEWVF